MWFTATPLAHHEYLVEGTDAAGVTDSTVVNGTQWDAVRERTRVREALEQFDVALEEFYAPLVEAAEQAERAVQRPELDPLLYVVEQEEVEAVDGQDRKVLPLDPGAVILRAVEEGCFDRLRWVKGELVVTAARPTPEDGDEPAFDGPTVPTTDQQAEPF